MLKMQGLNIKTKALISSICSLAMVAALFTGVKTVANASQEETATFNVNTSGPVTFETTQDTLYIPLESTAAGEATLSVTVSGISTATGDNVAKLGTSEYNATDISQVFVAMGYNTPGSAVSIAARFNTAGKVAQLSVTKPTADQGKNTKMTVVVETKGFANIAGESRALGANEDVYFAMNPNSELYWPLKVSELVVIDTEGSSNITLVDQSKNEIYLSNKKAYLNAGDYFIKTENTTSHVRSAHIKYTTAPVTKTVWDKNISKKNAQTIKVKKNVSGVIPSTAGTTKARYFKFTLKTKKKITFKNNMDNSYSFTIKNKKGKYLIDSGKNMISSSDVTKKGAAKFSLTNMDSLKTKKQKSITLPAGTYILELNGNGGEYSFKIG